MHTNDARAATERICDFFENLTPQSLAQVQAHYTDDARFKDPFNDVRGHAAITRIFEHMFHSLHGPRFVVTQRIVDGAQVFLVWEFHFRFRRFDTVTEQRICGGSHLVLAADGRISEHRDHWDAAEQLYEKLPGLGVLMRWLKRKANS